MVLCSSLCSTLKCGFFRSEVSISLVRVQILQPYPGRRCHPFPIRCSCGTGVKGDGDETWPRKVISEGTWERLPRLSSEERFVDRIVVELFAQIPCKFSVAVCLPNLGTTLPALQLKLMMRPRRFSSCQSAPCAWRPVQAMSSAPVARAPLSC